MWAMLSPWGEGESSAALRQIEACRNLQRRTAGHSLPKGEGRGEGEQSSRRFYGIRRAQAHRPVPASPAWARQRLARKSVAARMSRVFQPANAGLMRTSFPNSRRGRQLEFSVQPSDFNLALICSFCHSLASAANVECVL